MGATGLSWQFSPKCQFRAQKRHEAQFLLALRRAAWFTFGVGVERAIARPPIDRQIIAGPF